nr:hypothetical protein [uncultured Mucilaginibacter sp.]
MNTKQFYLKCFEEAAATIPADALNSEQLETAVGEYQNCVFLKLFKKAWANPSADIVTSPSRIFFSVWIDLDNGSRLYYNIHALKLRQLKGYKIESRKFAEVFRMAFKPFEKEWPQVSTNFGPLTLMQGHVDVSQDDLKETARKLSLHFLKITHLIDETLALSSMNR